MTDYDPSFVPEWAAPLKVDETKVQVGDQVYICHLLSRNLEPRLPGFIGFPGGTFLFASEDVPQNFLPHILTHEIREFTELSGQEGRCLNALKQELTEVPSTIMSEYLEYRLDFFRALVAFYAENDDSSLAELKREIAQSLEHLEQLTSSS